MISRDFELDSLENLRRTTMAELHLDLDRLDSNAQLVADRVAALGKQWRPHIKAHNEPRLAQRLMALGAVGITAARVVEVTRMAEAGIPSILLAHICVDEAERRQLAAAARRTQLLLCADHFVQLERYSQTAVDAGVTFEVLVDVNIGMDRTGCRPRVDATQLALAASQLPGLQVAGIFGYEGHLLTIEDPAEKQAQIFDAMNTLQQTRQAVESAGLSCPIVSAGASGSLEITGRHPVVTELQAGGAIFGDPFYTRCGLTGLQPALTVTADVVSRPALQRAVLNAGRKAINPFVQPPEVVGYPDVSIEQMNAEHTVLSLAGTGRELQIGDRVSLVVGYSDHTLRLHRQVHVHHSGGQQELWQLDG